MTPLPRFTLGCALEEGEGGSKGRDEVAPLIKSLMCLIILTPHKCHPSSRLVFASRRFSLTLPTPTTLSSFPPTLYYKIFSSGPMCDIGSFAPRDYTVSSGVNLDPSSLHNKSRLAQRDYPRRFEGSVTVGRREFGAEGFIGNEGTEGWYERVENNGWRAVTVKAQDELREDR